MTPELIPPTPPDTCPVCNAERLSRRYPQRLYACDSITDPEGKKLLHQGTICEVNALKNAAREALNAICAVDNWFASGNDSPNAFQKVCDLVDAAKTKLKALLPKE